MLKLTFSSTIFALFLTACAATPSTPTKPNSPTTAANTSQSTPATTTAQTEQAKKLIGHWHCVAHDQSDSAEFTSDDELRADGTWLSKNLILVALNHHINLKYQVDTNEKWRLEGNRLIVKETTPPQVKTLPADTPQETLLLQAFERDNPDFKTVQADFIKDMSQPNSDEKVYIINQLTDKEWKMTQQDSQTVFQCKRTK